MKQSSSFKSLLYSLCCCGPRGLKSFCSPGPVWEHHPWSITEALSGAWWWQRAPSPPAWSRFSFLGSLWDVLEPLDGLSYCEQCCRLCTPGSVPICCSHQLWSEMGTFLLCRGEHLARGWRHGCKPCAGKHDWCCSAGFPAAHFLELICPFWCSLSVGCFFPQQAPLRFVKHGYKAVLLFFFFLVSFEKIKRPKPWSQQFLTQGACPTPAGSIHEWCLQSPICRDCFFPVPAQVCSITEVEIWTRTVTVGCGFQLKCIFHRRVAWSPVIAFQCDESPEYLCNLKKGWFYMFIKG